MYDPVFDPKTQAAKSSIDAALGVAQRIQQRVGLQQTPQLAPVPQGAPVPGAQPRQQFPPQQFPPVWPAMPGANPLLQQLAAQYGAQPQYTQPPAFGAAPKPL